MHRRAAPAVPPRARKTLRGARCRVQACGPFPEAPGSAAQSRLHFSTKLRCTSPTATVSWATGSGRAAQQSPDFGAPAGAPGEDGGLPRPVFHQGPTPLPTNAPGGAEGRSASVAEGAVFAHSCVPPAAPGASRRHPRALSFPQ